MQHQELISLQSLVIGGAAVDFTQAVIVWQRGLLGTDWSGSARAAHTDGLPRPGDEAVLEALSLDGRDISGRVRIKAPDDELRYAFVGIGGLLVEGREL